MRAGLTLLLTLLGTACRPAPHPPSAGDNPTFDLIGQWRVDCRFEPRMPRAEAARLRARWTDAVERAKRWERA